MTSPLVLHLQATQESLQDGLSKVEQYFITSSIEKDTLSRVLIIIEELFTNTMKYGYHGECAGPVFLSLGIIPGTADSVVLVFEDEAPAFNPMEWDIVPSLTTDPQCRVVGRTGIALVLGLVQIARYARLESANQLTLTIGKG